MAADKAKELAAIANLKSQISTCEEVMKKNYLEIGKIYFQQYSDMPEPPFEKQCDNPFHITVYASFTYVASTDYFLFTGYGKVRRSCCVQYRLRGTTFPVS